MKSFIFEKIGEALMQTLSLNQDFQFEEHLKLKDDLGLDSMSSLTFLMALEDTIEGFEVDPDTLEMEHLETMDTIAEYVLQQVKRFGYIPEENSIYDAAKVA